MMGFGMSEERGLPSVQHVQVVALYDRDTGRIKHLHVVTTLSGATPQTQDEAIADAKRRASRRIPNVEDLGVALSNEAEHGPRPHYIDTNTGAFVPLANDNFAE